MVGARHVSIRGVFANHLSRAKAVQQSVTKCIATIVINLVTPSGMISPVLSAQISRDVVETSVLFVIIGIKGDDGFDSVMIAVGLEP
jgi:hypothetical protein